MHMQNLSRQSNNTHTHTHTQTNRRGCCITVLAAVRLWRFSPFKFVKCVQADEAGLSSSLLSYLVRLRHLQSQAED